MSIAASCVSGKYVSGEILKQVGLTGVFMLIMAKILVLSLLLFPIFGGRIGLRAGFLFDVRTHGNCVL